MLIWAEELIDESGFELIEPIAVMNVEGAPWRRFEYEFEDGLKTEEAPFALLAIFLHLLRSGVERSVAVRHILKMNPFSIKRWNQMRKWYERAVPKVLHHAVFFVPDVDKGISFYVKRLDFRVTDMIRNAGVFMRCDGRNDHHNPGRHEV